MISETTQASDEPGTRSITPEQRPRFQGWGWARWAWRSLTSMRTAVVLLSLLALAAVPGSLLPQRNVASAPAAVPTFYLEHPTLAPWLDRLDLFEVFSSAWFAAIYVLLLISMTGCVLPRCARLWTEVLRDPPRAARYLARQEVYVQWTSRADRDDLLAKAQRHLRRRRYRVVRDRDQIRAEKGYLREAGNLLFHLSLLILLFGIAGGRLFGFEGRVAIAEGGSFTNVRSEYDAFTPSVWTDVDGLEPLTLTLDSFDAEFALAGPGQGSPRDFDARISYRTDDGLDVTQARVQPNQPLDVNETKFFLTGHGYAPVVTVRDGSGDVAFSGPVIFLPADANFTSGGVVKAPDAEPVQLAFEGTFLPTAASTDSGPVSAYPDVLNPQLALTAYTGNLGMDNGAAQSTFVLERAGLDPVLGPDGNLQRTTLDVGETMILPNGQGSLTFDSISRFANFQVAYDPGKEISLFAALLLLIGLSASLGLPRRRLWVRVADDAVTGLLRVEVAGQPLSRRAVPQRDVEGLLGALGQEQTINEAPQEKTP